MKDHLTHSAVVQSFAKVGIQKKPPLVYRQLRSTEVALALVHKSDIYVPVDLSLNSRVILVLKLSIFTSKEKNL